MEVDFLRKICSICTAPVQYKYCNICGKDCTYDLYLNYASWFRRSIIGFAEEFLGIKLNIFQKIIICLTKRFYEGKKYVNITN